MWSASARMRSEARRRMRPRSIAARACHGPSACLGRVDRARDVLGRRVDGGADDLARGRVRDVEAPAVALDPLPADRHAVVVRGNRRHRQSPSVEKSPQAVYARARVPDARIAGRRRVGAAAATAIPEVHRAQGIPRLLAEGQPPRAGRGDRHGHRVRRGDQVARRQPDHADHRHDRRRRLLRARRSRSTAACSATASSSTT